MDKTLSIDLSYYEHPRGTEIEEAEVRRNNLRWELPVERVALVCVDVWSEHYVATHLVRTTEITLEKIVPLQAAFREAGALVVHGPSPDCARKYGEWLEEEVEGPASAEADWPPAAFRRKESEFAGFARPHLEKTEEFDRIIRDRSIVPDAAPREDDRVIINGEALHRLLERRGVLYLFYVGFAANMCVPFRNYGMRAMKSRGYEIILVEDCTTAIEVAETAADWGLSRAGKAT